MAIGKRPYGAAAMAAAWYIPPDIDHGRLQRVQAKGAIVQRGLRAMAAGVQTPARAALLVFPIVLGLGKRFFSEGVPPRELALVDVKATESGVLISTYKLDGPLRTGTIGS